jgi:hypothetical protein
MDRQAAWVVAYELRANHGLPTARTLSPNPLSPNLCGRLDAVNLMSTTRRVFAHGSRFLGISRCQPGANRLITVQHIAIHGPRPRSDARSHIAADRAHQEERDDRRTPSVEARQRTRQRW